MSMHEISEDEFGFGAVAASTKDRIRQIKPAAPPERHADMAKIDAVADNAGFVSREVPPALDYSYQGRRAPRGYA
jgi:hypothetical protein